MSKANRRTVYSVYESRACDHCGVRGAVYWGVCKANCLADASHHPGHSPREAGDYGRRGWAVEERRGA
jgi:hypothetical protein